MKVKPLASFQVTPNLPESLTKLNDLAYNLLWSWTPDIQLLFENLDESLWEKTSYNPARLLKEVSQSRLDSMSRDAEFLALYNKCVQYLESYMKETSWFDKVGKKWGNGQIIYFSMEYGICESLPVYSGGLGVLSGDHLKAASDLGLPIVGIGLAYHEGYFQQQLSADGLQTELYPQNNFNSLPITPVLDNQGNRLKIMLEFPNRKVYVGAWRAQVGRIPLYLLDTDLPDNDPIDRKISHKLYGGDKETRIQQEIVLGMGGITMADKLGIQSTICHMNEGHSAFVQLARLAKIIDNDKISLNEALELISAGTIFTTHTPVPAGIDQFSADLMDKYFSYMYPKLGVTKTDLMAMGSKSAASGALFNMAIFALHSSVFANGVSRLHAEVSKELWADTWSSLPHDDIPIGYVTNAIHLLTWIAEPFAKIYDQILGSEWQRDSDGIEMWKKIHQVPDEKIWDTHQLCKDKLISFVRRRVAEHRTRTTGVELTAADLKNYLDPNALTIGFARRFATYKRATLLLRKPARLLSLLKDSKRPLQIVFAGKAHPQDEEGKALIRDIIHFAKSEGVEQRLIFLENYDLQVARYLVQGVDVWLNNPRRPLEASGTSGMKVLGNGGLNFSILDGWWDEAYQTGVGWHIGVAQNYTDGTVQDEKDADSLYNVLEQQILPLYYTRNEQNLPHLWINKMKNSMADLTPQFSTQRMLREYFTNYYEPSQRYFSKLKSDNLQGAMTLFTWKDRVETHWSEIQFKQILAKSVRRVTSGSVIEVFAEVEFGALSAKDVEVQIYYGEQTAGGDLRDASTIQMQATDPTHFVGKLKTSESGQFGYTVRIIPRHDLLENPLRMGLVVWGENIVTAK